MELFKVNGRLNDAEVRRGVVSSADSAIPRLLLLNIEVLLRYGNHPKRTLSVMVREATRAITRKIRPLLGLAKALILSETNWILSPEFAISKFQRT
jgi:hypothetical protein